MKHLPPFFIFCILIIVCFNVTVPQTRAETCYNAFGDTYTCGTNPEDDTGNGFIPLVGIPYIDTQDPNLSLGGYVDALYKAAISIAAFMAVVKIIFAGVKYMLSDVVTSKEDAKKDIRGALIGLLIVLGAVLILNTINPQLTGLNVLEGAPGLELGLKTYDKVNCSKQPIPPACCAEGEEYFLLVNNTALCAASISNADEQILDTKLTEVVKGREILSEYGLEDIPGEFRNSQDRFNWIDTNWAEPCEYNSTTQEETGNEWLEIELVEANNIRYACVASSE